MKICGIIAEYNPFHNGHFRHINETRRILGNDTAIVCVMSGNFVQRGDFAILEKYRRAEMAIRCGADLVIELPLTACLSSASGFAAGAVAVLEALGCVTHLSFGSECGDIAPLQKTSALVLSHLKTPQTHLGKNLSAGLSFASAVQQAIAGQDAEAAALLASPNNTLGIEYLAALQKLHSKIVPITVKRIGGAHDSSDTTDQLPSASLLRRLIADEGVESCKELMPEEAFSVLQLCTEQGEAPVLSAACDQAITAHLRRLSPDDLLRYVSGRDGLENRIYQAARPYTSFAEICAAAQTRRYPLARIRRTVLRAWLDLPHALSPFPSYLRVLGMSSRAPAILKAAKSGCALPIITKPTSERQLPEALQPLIARDELADDLYALAYPSPSLRAAGERWRKTPYFRK